MESCCVWTVTSFEVWINKKWSSGSFPLEVLDSPRRIWKAYQKKPWSSALILHSDKTIITGIKWMPFCLSVVIPKVKLLLSKILFWSFWFDTILDPSKFDPHFLKRYILLWPYYTLKVKIQQYNNYCYTVTHKKMSNLKFILSSLF